jgi:hypothetical protein
MLKGQKNILKFGFLSVIAFGVNGCIEEIPIQTDSASISEAGNAIVVEANLSDLIETQKVVLSRVADFENDSIIAYDAENPSTYLFPVAELQSRPVLYEQGARVRIIDDRGFSIDFAEGEPGHYFSSIPFGAEAEVGYKLEIGLKDGRQIYSNFEQLNGTSEISNIAPRRISDPELGEGIGFFINTKSAEAGSAYHRYTFEETFKVVAPLWNPQDFVLSDYNPCADPVTYTLELANRNQQEQVCYRTQASQDVLLSSTQGLAEGILSDYKFHFIPKDDFKIAHRYSLEILQQTISLDAFLFYQNLRNFSQQENVFSQIQPGLLQGNLISSAGSGDLVIGYFTVSALIKKRIFLNYEDFFPGEPEPPFVVPCILKSSPESHASRCPEVPVQGGGTLCPLSIIELLDLGDIIRYAGPYQDDMNSICPGPYAYVPRVCGDCTVLGTNIAPAFWQD